MLTNLFPNLRNDISLSYVLLYANNNRIGICISVSYQVFHLSVVKIFIWQKVIKISKCAYGHQDK